MNKKILLAVDDSMHSLNAIQYAVKTESFVKNLSYTLFNVQPNISQYLTDDAQGDAKAKSALEKLKKRQAESAQEILDKYKIKMTEMGIDDKLIDVKTLPRNRGLARDILEHAEQGRYDAIIVGRRGLSRIQEVFTGSLTTNLLEHSKVIPVWVIDGEASSSKIMIATDGSESALRAVDHVSFMVGRNPDIKITLFHVIPRIKDICRIELDDSDKEIEEIMIKGNKKRVESFIANAHNKFKDAGISESQIDIKEVKAIAKIGKVIAEEAEKGDYGTVVVGRRGVSKAFFMGSVSKYVLDRTSNRALWLVS